MTKHTTFPRTMGDAFRDANYASPLTVYQRSLSSRCARALIAMFLMLAASIALFGCGEVEDATRTEHALNDALQQAQRERPDLWTPEQKARAKAAVQIAANGGEQ